MEMFKLLWQKMILRTHVGIHCHYLQKITAGIFLCLCLSSCVQIQMKDVSAIPEYASIIGKQFRTNEELWATSIRSNKNDDWDKRKVDYIVLVPGVGFSGPEVVSRERLNRGFILRVVRILKARSSLFSRMTYIVEEVGSNKFKDNEVQIDLPGDIHDRNYGLDESVYSLVEGVSP